MGLLFAVGVRQGQSTSQEYELAGMDWRRYLVICMRQGQSDHDVANAW